MYDSFKVNFDEHELKNNWWLIAQRGNNCVRTYVLDKSIIYKGREVKSQAYIFYNRNTPVYVLQVWPYKISESRRIIERLNTI